MKNNLKKALSWILVLAFVLSAIPFAGIVASAEVLTYTMDDGTQWLVELGDNVYFQQNDAPRDYILGASDTDDYDNRDFAILSKTGFVPGLDNYAVSVNYAGTSPEFGFVDDCDFDCQSKISFFRTENGNATTLQVSVGGSEYVVWSGTATRASLCKTEIVKQNGSYFLKYRGTVIDGAGLDTAVQNYLKFENHFSKKMLDSKGMLHFYLKANSFIGEPRIVNLGKITDRYVLVDGYTFSGDVNDSASWNFSGQIPSIEYYDDRSLGGDQDGKWKFSAKDDATITFGFPIAMVSGNSADAAFWLYASQDKNVSSDTDWETSYLSFSNDPYFTNPDEIEKIATLVQPGTNYVHLQYNGETVEGFSALYTSANPGYTFSSTDGTTVDKLTISSTEISLTNGRLKTNKPIYLRVHKGASEATRSYTVYYCEPGANGFYVAGANARNALVASDLTDETAAKESAQTFLGSCIGYDYAAQEQITKLYKDAGLGDGPEADAYEIDNKVYALPDIDSLLYQDKAIVQEVIDLYDNSDATVKAYVQTKTLIESYRTAIADLEFDGLYRTGDGKLYRVTFGDPDLYANGIFIIKSRDGDNALMTDINASDISMEPGSAETMATATKYPIVSGKYEMSSYFGNYFGAANAIGFAADEADMSDLFNGGKNNFFALYRSETGNVNTFNVMINGVFRECYSVSGTSRARTWTIGVTKIGDDYYMTVDGKAITGEDYDEGVQEAVKLNNYFSKDFLDNNFGVYFFNAAKSMYWGATLRACVDVENNMIIDTQNRFNDRNANPLSSNDSVNLITEANTYTPSQKTGTATGGNKYQFTVPSAGAVTLAEPINKDGFDIKGSLPVNVNQHQFIKFTFSNDPLFMDTANQISCSVGRLNNGEETLYDEATETELNSRFTGFFSGANNSMLFVEDPDTAGVYRLRFIVNGGTYTVWDMDFASLMNAPVYMKITSKTGSKPSFTIQNKANDAPYLTNQSAIDTATETFLADEATAIYNEMKQLTELETSEYSWYLDEIKAADAEYARLSARQVERVAEISETVVAMARYAYSLPAEVNAGSLIGCKNRILGVVVDDPYSYDYTNDSSENILDLVRMKKIAANEKKKLELEEYETDKLIYDNLDYPVKTLYVSSFGAKGDGSTDDAAAIADAVEALTECGPGSKLLFEANKTYYAKDIQTEYALIELFESKGLSIVGNNSKVVVDALKPYADIWDTKNCKISGLTFDYKTKPAFVATCTSVDKKNGTAVFTADRDIGLANKHEFTAPDASYFGIINTTEKRCHMYITKIKNENGNIRITFNKDDENTMNWLDLLTDNGLICPMPYYGHTLERAFSVTRNTNLSLSDININSCYKFGMFICQNEGTLTMDNVNFVPADNDLDRNVNFTSWRDAFHVKDNRCKIIWKNCTAVGNQDDVFNISSSTMHVSEYDESSLHLTTVWDEAANGKGGVYYPIKAGDELQVIDTATGLECGKVKVVDVIAQENGENVIRINKPLDNFGTAGKNVLAFFTNRCAPDSVIDNCNFSGTFRFRGPITLKNSTIYNFRTWIDVLGGIEGPVPAGITYDNCTINSAAGATIIVDSYNGNPDGYHVSDIVFNNCVVDTSTIKIGTNDADYVSITGCTNP